MIAELIILGIDVNDATVRFAGKFELYAKTLKKFAADISKNGIMAIEEAMGMEPEEWRKYIHGLKGITANLSITNINKLLIEVEQSIKDGNPDYGKYREICDSLPALANKIMELFAGEDENTDKENGSPEECRQLLKMLSAYLLFGKAKECEQVIDQLRAKNWTGIAPDLIEKICNAVEGYDYAKAMEIINDIG